MKKYQSYKSTGVDWIGDIPENWLFLPLKYFYSYTKGKNGQLLTSTYIDENKGDYPVHSGMTNNDGVLGYWNEYEFDYKTNVIFTTTVGAKFMTTKLLKGKFSLSQNCLIMYPKNNLSKPDFIHYYLEYDFLYQKELIPTIIQPSLRMEDLDKYFICLPPLQEQEQIVNYLDGKTIIIDKLISTKQRKVELLKEQRTTLINQVITKGLKPNVKMKDSGVEWIGEIPEKWNFVRLGVLGNFSKGKGITKDKIKENGFPCIRNGEIYTTYNLRFSEPKSFIDEITITESIKVNKGTLFFTGDGETLEEIGKCVVYLGEEEIYVGGGINVFTPKTDKVSPIYLSYVMSSTSCVYQKSIGGKGEIVVHIYSKQLRDIQFGLPTLEEQQQIVEYLDIHTKEIDDLVSLEKNKIELLKEYRQSLISEVITGKIKVV